MNYNDIPQFKSTFGKYTANGVPSVYFPIPCEDTPEPEPQGNTIELGAVTLTYDYGQLNTQDCKIPKTDYTYEQYEATSTGTLFRIDGEGEFVYDSDAMGPYLNTDLTEYQDYCLFTIFFEVYEPSLVPVGEHLVEFKCPMVPVGESEPVDVIISGTFTFPTIEVELNE